MSETQTTVSCWSLMLDVKKRVDHLVDVLLEGNINPTQLHKDIEFIQQRLSACEESNKICWVIEEDAKRRHGGKQ